MQNHDRLISGIIEYTGAAVAIWLVSPETAHAFGVQSTVNSIVASMKHMPTILSGAAYIYGASTAFAGALKLKTHAEEPTKVKLMEGLSRIIIGGTFSVLPVLIEWVNNSLSIGDIKLLFSSMGKIA